MPIHPWYWFVKNLTNYLWCCKKIGCHIYPKWTAPDVWTAHNYTFLNILSKFHNFLLNIFNLSDMDDTDGSLRLVWGRGFQSQQWWSKLMKFSFMQTDWNPHISNFHDLSQYLGSYRRVSKGDERSRQRITNLGLWSYGPDFTVKLTKPI